MTALLQRMDAAARNLLPFALGLAAVLIGTTPLYLPGYGAVAPDLALMVVFYWAIYRPDLFPAAVAFAVGLVQDALMGTPMGLNALVLVAAYGAIVTQRKFFQNKSFLVVWWAFSLVGLCAALMSWALMSVLAVRLVDPLPALFAGLVTVGLYPFAGWLNARMHHAALPELHDVP
jgi:rod shape-determining protein MreD